ncbi:MAG: DUF5667 domain-containing protein [Candidatus Nanohaloarchaea archaeon]
MKSSLVLLAAVLMVSAASAQAGQPALENPTALPGSLAYGLDQAMESLSLILTFQRREKLQMKINFAEERLAESYALAKRNRTRAAERTAKRYIRGIEEIRERKSSLEKEEQRKIEELLNETRDTRKTTLNRVLESLPAEAEQGIETAIENSPLETVGVPADIPSGPSRSPGFSASGRVQPAPQSPSSP